jgi:hypothetical protein
MATQYPGGGAVYNSGTAVAYINDCTIAGNTGPLANGLYNQTAQTYLQSNIFKGASGSANLVNSQGTITSEGFNLSSDSGGGFLTASSDLRSTEPFLQALAWNGGPTQTHALQNGSSAINRGSTTPLQPFDQRGFSYLGTNDIGAYEFNGGELRIISITRSSNDVTVRFNAPVQRTFRLERRSDLLSGRWQPVSGVSDLTTDSTNPMQFTDPGAVLLGHGFYRVRYISPF